MENKYIYKGQDITIDVVMKIEKITRLIAEQESCDFDKAYCAFLESKTYASLQNTESLMWAESEEFIVDEYYKEHEN
jgi:hypothetical protein